MSGLRDLEEIARAVLQARLARLAAAESARRATARQLAALDSERARQEAEVAAAFEADLCGPVRDRWGDWEGAQRALLNMQLARQAAGLEAARAEAIAAFGKAEALRRIAGKAAGRRP